MAEAFSMGNLSDWVGKELGASNWVLIDQARVNQFAETTGDRQWIHVDVERAKRESPFGGPVAHGYLVLSLLAGWSLDMGIVPSDAVACFNYGLNKTRFVAPVPVGARVRGRATLTAVEPQGGGRVLLTIQNTIEIEGGTKPAVVAETLALVVGKA